MSEEKENNFIVGIVGCENFEVRNLIGQALGAPGTKSDIQFYNRLDESLGQVFCALTPVDYPEKLKPFLQILKISDIHILVIDLEIGLNAAIGEVLTGIDLFHQLFQTQCLVCVSNITDKTQWKLDETLKNFKKILATTSLKDTEIFEIHTKDDYDTLKEKIVEIGGKIPKEVPESASYTKILIDHVFPVKGIGTVILGVVKKGIVNASQMYEIAGYDDGSSKKIIVRSIQKHDRNFKIAYEGDRVGLALKGKINPDDVSRDNIISTPNIFTSVKKFQAKVAINNFYKPKGGKITPGDGVQYHAFVDIKTTPFKFTGGEELSPGGSGELIMECDKALIHDGSGLKGIIAERNKFDNKLRIVGSFEQI